MAKAGKTYVMDDNLPPGPPWEVVKKYREDVLRDPLKLAELKSSRTRLVEEGFEEALDSLAWLDDAPEKIDTAEADAPTG